MSPNFKAEAHHLKPIVSVGKNGLTENVLREIDAGLQAHELIKIKFHESALQILKENPEPWLLKLKAILIATQGHILTLYRKNPPV